MSQPWDISIAANSGGPVRLAGVATGEPSGGSQPTYASRGLYSGDAVSVVHGVFGATLTWDTLGSGMELLDRTDPANPEILASGIYAVTVSVEAQAFFAAGGIFLAVLHLDADDEDAVCEMTSNDQIATGDDAFTAIVSLNSTYYIPAGGVIRATVLLRDGASTINFRLREATIQMLPGGPA